ncbi:hypothetical protein Hte_000183 [Hypoxylon texense]
MIEDYYIRRKNLIGWEQIVQGADASKTREDTGKFSHNKIRPTHRPLRRYASSNSALFTSPSDQATTLVNWDSDEDDDVASEKLDVEVAASYDVRTATYLVSILVQDLLNKVGAKCLDSQTVKRLSSILPTLLKAVALNLGHEASSQTLRDVMVFVHEHRE